MDPQAAWNQLQEAYQDGNWDDARELAQSLLDWLNRDGFPPVTNASAESNSSQQRAEAAEFCRLAIRRATEARSS